SLRLLPHERDFVLPPVDRSPRSLSGTQSPSERRPRRRLLLHQHEEASSSGRGRLRPPIRHPARRRLGSTGAGGISTGNAPSSSARQDEHPPQCAPLRGLREQTEEGSQLDRER